MVQWEKVLVTQSGDLSVISRLLIKVRGKNQAHTVAFWLVPPPHTRTNAHTHMHARMHANTHTGTGTNKQTHTNESDISRSKHYQQRSQIASFMFSYSELYPCMLRHPLDLFYDKVLALVCMMFSFVSSYLMLLLPAHFFKLYS